MSIPVQLLDVILQSGILGNQQDEEEDDIEEDDDMDEPLETHMNCVQLEEKESYNEDPSEEIPVVDGSLTQAVECDLDWMYRIDIVL